jgi:hypothetical protein
MKKETFVVDSKKLLSLSLFACLVTGLIIFPGCGKQEAAGGTFGAASGALIGAAVAGHNDTATGAIIGGLVGSMAGSAIGRAGDDEEEEEIRFQRDMNHRQEVAQLEEENRRLREKWCINCRTHVSVAGAQRCPRCSGDLIREKYCPRCYKTYRADSSDKYCMFCKEPTQLQGR